MTFLSIYSVSAAAADDNALSTSIDQNENHGEFALLSPDYWAGSFADFKEITISPLHWEGSDWGKAGLIVGITYLLYRNDSDIRDWFQDNRNNTSDSISKYVKSLGNPFVVLPLSALYYYYGYQTDDIRAQRTGLLSFETILQCEALTYGLKFATHRSRPETGDLYDTWDGLDTSTSDAHLSFPSSHAARSFGIATIVAEEYKDRPIIPILSYSLATLTSLSRINDDQHWSSDVFLGAAIGYFTAKNILSRHPDNEDSWTVIPAVYDQGVGLSLSYRF